MKNLLTLKEFMAPVKTVEQWNERREEAKKLFSQKLIYQLDCSGYISEVLKKQKRLTDEA